jgi:hypothetical protein
MMLAGLERALGIIRGTLEVPAERVSAADAVKVFIGARAQGRN